MASVSGATSSLGNTSLRGYGGLGSGIDRDSIIEQMTAGTQSKITNQKNKMTSLGWKQEAFQTVSDKILSLQDNYFSFASGSNLKYPSMFAKNQITSMGDSDITKFVTATGSSNMLDYLSILGVKQLASSSTLQSAVKGTSSINTNITGDSLTNSVYKSSLLQGRQLRFGTYSGDQYQSAGIFTFPPSYMDKDADGRDITVPIDYTIELDDVVEVDGVTMTGGEKLAMQLNKALSHSGIQSGDDSISDVMEFVYADGKMQLQAKAGTSTNLIINSSSSALTALGFNPQNADGSDKTVSDGISLNELNANQKNFNTTYVNKQTMTQYLTGKKLTISFGGQTKQVELVKSGDSFSDLDELRDIIQGRLNQAFGTDNIKVYGGTRLDEDGNPVLGDDGNPIFDDPLYFGLGSNASPNQTLTINSDSAEVRNVLGIQKGASNKLNLEGSIRDNIDKLITDDEPDAEAKRTQFLESLESDGLVINGVKIAGVTANTSLQDMIDKINNNKDVGVKASFLSSTNQFVLVASETGKGRQIDLDSDKADGSPNEVANVLFGGTFTPGKNAEIEVSYGNGVNTTIESSSNTFDLEGLRVTVSQEFGYKEVNGVMEPDRTQAVTFSAKADVDGVTEIVKKFIEEYNEMIKEINTQVTTRPDKSYGPLSEEQKEEMSEKSIENWEKKAKQGLLYNDATMRALNMDMQGVLTSLMASGVNYKDLEEMGLTISDDYLDGGTITFDEAKFKAAMTSDPEKVSNIFTGGGDVKKGLASIIEDTLTPYATKYANRNGNSYGRLIEEAGSEKIPLSVMNNQIYKQLKQMQQDLDTLNARLASEQDRYISQFTTMETLINQMNSQASYLSQFQA